MARFQLFILTASLEGFKKADPVDNSPVPQQGEIFKTTARNHPGFATIMGRGALAVSLFLEIFRATHTSNLARVSR